MGWKLGLAAAVVLLAGGCKDLGVRGSANTPVNLARTKPAVFWAYQAVNPAQRKAYEGRTGDRFTLGDQSFIVQFPAFAGSPATLRAVGSAAGAPVYALRWDEAPFGELVVAATPAKLQIAEPLFR